MQIQKIVLTGGPCAGKSTTLEALAKEFGDKLVLVPEAATLLLSGGFPVPGKHVAWSVGWSIVFQTAVTSLQTSLEQAYSLVAKEKGAKVMVCDRGRLDGAAYTQGGRPEFAKSFGIDVDATLKEYAAVIHLESLATARPELYGTGNNENRFEPLEEAQALEARTREAWAGHCKHLILLGDRGLNRSISRVFDTVRQLLAA